MFNLVFLFTGLCAFALEPGANYPPDRLDVVLVDKAPHVGMLVVSADQLVQAMGDLPPRRELGAGDSHVGFPLHGWIVRVVNGADTAGKVKWSTSANDPGCPIAADKDSYEWVVPFKNIAPGKGKILETMRRPSQANPPPEVHAKVELEAGGLTTTSFARTEDDRVLKWRFNGGPDRGGFDTALGDLVELRQEGLSGTIVLQFERIDKTASGLLVLGSSGRSDILVEVFNQPLANICCSDHDTFEVGDKDSHFCDLFALLPPGHTCTAPEAVEPCPALAADPDYLHRCKDTCAISYGNPQCPGGDATDP